MTADQAFDRLAPFLREFIYANAWADLRPIQVEAIEAILDSSDDVLIAAGTASGKTEAACLPIFSLIHPNPTGSVRALYVGPLKALINDQFERLVPLCDEGGIPVHHWHGDVPADHKSDLLRNPGGILQITPESIESLLINQTRHLSSMFGGLRFVIIDEVHSFLESDRGVQLRSQLERLSAYVVGGRPRRIGLSATVGDFDVARRWLNPHAPDRVRLIHPAGAKADVRLSVLHFPDAEDLPSPLLDDLLDLTRHRRSLIFCNSRADVESVTAQLNERCRRERIDERYWPHHSSISREAREDAEARMKDASRPCSIVCTSTLELGIDVGQLDLVVQIDSTHSNLSFEQRLGRSGRRGNPRAMQVYTTQPPRPAEAPIYERLPFSLLQALAVIELFAERWVEPPAEQARAYHVLVQQILSRLVETNGCAPRDLVGFFHHSGAFPAVTLDEYAALLRHLAAIDHIQQLADGQLIVGLAGEQIVRSRDFYAVFQSAAEWQVTSGGRALGRVAPSPDLDPGACLVLAGKLWQVQQVFAAEKEVTVIPATAARHVLYSGGGIPDLHPRMAQHARAILERDDTPGYLSPAGQAALAEARAEYRRQGLHERDTVTHGQPWVVFPWTGTRAARTLLYRFRRIGLEADFPGRLAPWVITIEPDGWRALVDRLRELLSDATTPEQIVAGIPDELLRTHKHDEHVPEALLRARAATQWLDWDEAQRVLRRLAGLATPRTA